MTTVLRKSKHIARKKYTCNACEWIDALLPYDLSDYEMTYTELKEIVKARRNGWQIVPGQQYIREIGIYEGDFYVWRGIPAIDAICYKYDIYDYV